MAKKIEKRTCRTAFAAAAAVLGAAVLAGLALAAGRPLGSVDGAPFYEEELLLYTARYRAAVSAEFCRDYGLPGTGSGFWTEEYGGQQPVETLLDRAMDALTADKAAQQLCAERGIEAPLDFRQMEKELAQENADRRQALDAGGIVYGTRQYTLDQYSAYRMTATADALKESLLTGEDAPGEEVLRAAFDSLDESRKRRDFTAQGWLFLWPGDTEPAAGQAAIAEALAAGTDPETLPEQLGQVLPQLQVYPIELNTAQRSKDDTLGDLLADVLFDLEPGVCRAGQLDGENAVYYLTGKEGGGYYTFEEAPRLGESKYVNEAYDRMVRERASAARVELDYARARRAVLADLQ